MARGPAHNPCAQVTLGEIRLVYTCPKEDQFQVYGGGDLCRGWAICRRRDSCSGILFRRHVSANET